MEDSDGMYKINDMIRGNIYAHEQKDLIEIYKHFE